MFSSLECSEVLTMGGWCKNGGVLELGEGLPKGKLLEPSENDNDRIPRKEALVAHI